ncbi:MAG: RluA family pseudouridine synthase [Xenococcus sp. MO_188.B8]|nr:RluA family pseudouridine synthase [Xenococcus sp. MO_188.B8]
MPNLDPSDSITNIGENIIELQVDTQGDRLDRWLANQLTDISRSRIQKLIEEGHVTLNGKACSSKKISVGNSDRIQIIIPTLQQLDVQPENIPLDILYEDEHLIIVNKPPGLVVHPAPGHPEGTLVNALLYHCQNLAGIGGVERPGIVHRLDKDTTGAIVVAKSDRAHQHLQAQIQAKTARREYWGVICGCPQLESGTINLPVGRHKSDRKKMAVIPVEQGGRAAITHWSILERLGNYTLMQFLLETGRTHQIRVHCSHIGHPIVGDPLYGSGGSVRVNLSGQALHARKLTIEHPVSGTMIEAIAPLPDEFTKLLRVLRARLNK